MGEASQSWNSLEIVKLLLGSLIPIAIVSLGFWFSRITHQIAASQWANQKLIEKRISIYDQVGPLLNDVYCYFDFRGHWKELTPPDIIRKKRELDRAMYVYKPVFSPELFKNYGQLMHLYFRTYNYPGTDAKLRTTIKSVDGDRSKVTPCWRDDWATFFTDNSEVSERSHVWSYHERLITSFSSDLGRLSGQLSTAD